MRTFAHPCEFVAAVDPKAYPNPHTNQAAQWVVDEGWPMISVFAWAIATAQLSSHYLATLLGTRQN